MLQRSGGLVVNLSSDAAVGGYPGWGGYGSSKAALVRLTEGLASGYNHWSLVWPGTDGGLIQIEFPWNQAEWTNAPPGTPTQSHGYWLTPSYWAMKHFSYYITAGSRRIAASCTDANLRVSAYLTADNLRLNRATVDWHATADIV